MRQSLLGYLGRHHVAILALFIALGGTSYAAVSLPRNSVGSSQLRNGAVTPAKVSKQTISKFRGQRGATGSTGATGATGATGSAASIDGVSVGGDLTGTLPDPTLAPGALTASDFPASLQDGAAGTATLRSLGTGAQQAAPGDDSRFPTSTETAALTGSSGTPSSANPYVTSSDPRLFTAASADYYNTTTVAFGIVGPFIGVPFNTVGEQSGLTLSSGDDITVTTAGRYLIQGELELQATSSSSQTVTFTDQLTDNGNPIAASQSWLQVTATASDNPVETLPVQAIVTLSAGDVIKLEAAADGLNSVDAITADNPSGLGGTPVSVQLSFVRIS